MRDPKTLGKKGAADFKNMKDVPPAKRVANGNYVNNEDSGGENAMVEEVMHEVKELDPVKKKYIEKCIKDQNYRKVKVSELKEYMEFYKLNSVGRLKDDCVNAVKNLMKRNGLL